MWALRPSPLLRSVSVWRAGKIADWPAYYAWCERWLDYRTTWAVIPDVIDGGTLSASTLEFAARLETSAGEIIGNRARTSLVWECTPGGWKIVREHTSVRIVSREEIDAIVPHSDK